MSESGTGQSGQEPEKVSLQFPGGSAEFPLVPSTDGASSIDFSTLTRHTGLTSLDYGFVNTAAP